MPGELDHRADVAGRQGGQREAGQHRGGFGQRAEGERRARESVLVLGAVGQHEADPRQAGIEADPDDDVERRRVRPLQVIEEEEAGPPAVGHGVQQGQDGELEAVTVLLDPERRRRRQIPEEHGELREETAQDGRRGPQPLPQIVPHLLEFRRRQHGGAAQPRPEGLDEGGVGNVANDLVELARNHDRPS